MGSVEDSALSTVEVVASNRPDSRERSLTGRQFFWRRLRRRRVALVGMAIFGFWLAMAAVGPYVAPYNYAEQDVMARNEPPSLTHPCGTDQYGRDVFSRILVGARSVFLLGGIGTILAVIIGTAVGLLSGYRGGWCDEIVMRLLDVSLAFPALLIALVLLSTVGPSSLNLLLVVTLLYVPSVARVVRSMVLDLKTKEFVEAARMRGEKSPFIVFREILPNAAPPLLVEASMRFSYSVFLVASLGFLGLGVQPPSADWGLQINEARSYLELAPWSLLYPAAAIASLVVATSLMSDGLRQATQVGVNLE